jgi:hypothetical protein
MLSLTHGLETWYTYKQYYKEQVSLTKGSSFTRERVKGGG